MIDELGLKGFSIGDARVSDRHANFFVNAGRATAKDMLRPDCSTFASGFNRFMV